MGACTSGPSKPSTDIHTGLVRSITDREYSERYETLAELGAGSMGAIYVAHKVTAANRSVGAAKQHATQREFAIKTIVKGRVTPELIQELENEIEILRRLDHPHVNQLHEVMHCRRRIYCVMDLCEGGSLAERDIPTEAAVADTMCQLLRGIIYLHANNICHRDLKLENIMYDKKGPDGRLQLIDFGLSKMCVGVGSALLLLLLPRLCCYHYSCATTTSTSTATPTMLLPLLQRETHY